MKRDFNGLEILKAVSETYGELRGEIAAFADKMSADIEAAIEAAIDAHLAALRAAEAARETRLVETELQIKTAISDLNEQKAAVLSNIRDHLEQFDTTAEERAAALDMLASEIAQVVASHGAFMEKAKAEIAEALAAMGETSKAAFDTLAESQQAEQAARAIEHANLHEEAIGKLYAAQSEAIAEQAADIAARIEQAQAGLNASFAEQAEALGIEALAAIKEGVASVSTEHAQSIQRALAEMETALADISGSVETHVGAMLAGAVEKALSDSPLDYRGEPGERGDPGEKGDPGERGAPGIDGQSVEFQGVWKAELEYRPGDIVVENGSTWIARRITHDESPSRMASDPHPPWAIVAQRGIKGERGVRGERGPAGTQGDAGMAAPPIIGVEIIGRELALVLEDGALLKAAIPDELLIGIAQRAAGFLQGNGKRE